MRKYFAYIRVSTIRQGEKGASLPEQKSVIEAYARREGCGISQWYEERETAAKVGRTVFRQMLQALTRGEAHGLILHKIDRGARNLKDWAALSELSDAGIDVRIAGDSIDMTSRGGRLSADIQAVVAADYIRNLRDEVKKGQRGRLKQGLYPWQAPVGYLNLGSGEIKKVDPILGPLVVRAFVAYGSGSHTLQSLSALMHTWGLSTAAGKPYSPSRVNRMLRRSFYIGMMDAKGTKYLGIHEPLITKELFDRVGDILSGRRSDRIFDRYSYSLRRLLRCGSCDRFLYAETQKGLSYFRCHSKSCRGTSLRESVILEQLFKDLAIMNISPNFLLAFEEAVEIVCEEIKVVSADRIQALQLQMSQLDDRMIRLTDAYIDRTLDKEDYERRRTSILMEKVRVEEKLRELADPEKKMRQTVNILFELLKGLRGIGFLKNPHENRRILNSAISNCTISQKSIEIQWFLPLEVLLQARGIPVSGDDRSTNRAPSEANTEPVGADNATQYGEMEKEVDRQIAAEMIRTELERLWSK